MGLDNALNVKTLVVGLIPLFNAHIKKCESFDLQVSHCNFGAEKLTTAYLNTLLLLAICNAVGQLA